MTQQQTQRRTVDIYTDGACSGNPGPGGWAAILKYGEHAKEISGNMHHTTNNRMELFAVISALGALKEPCKVRVHSDSSYVVDAFNKRWIDSWQNNGWKTADKKPVENQDLWRLLLIAMRKHEVSFHKVPGHADHPENNRCDELAKMEVQQVIKSFNQTPATATAEVEEKNKRA
jgi:ribonuclease HI